MNLGLFGKVELGKLEGPLRWTPRWRRRVSATSESGRPGEGAMGWGDGGVGIKEPLPMGGGGVGEVPLGGQK